MLNSRIFSFFSLFIYIPLALYTHRPSLQSAGIYQAREERREEETKNNICECDEKWKRGENVMETIGPLSFQKDLTILLLLLPPLSSTGWPSTSRLFRSRRFNQPRSASLVVVSHHHHHHRESRREREIDIAIERRRRRRRLWRKEKVEEAAAGSSLFFSLYPARAINCRLRCCCFRELLLLL